MTEQNSPSALAVRLLAASLDVIDSEGLAAVADLLDNENPHRDDETVRRWLRVSDVARKAITEALTAARAEWASAAAERTAAARREGREAGLREAAAAVQEQYFTCDNDIEMAKCEGISMAHGAITALIANLQEPT